MNKLENGAVLPNGLLSDNQESMMAGFNKSYKNNALRVGVITACYPVSDQKNRSKLTTEYDVLVVEQHEDKGATTIQYRNCMSSEGLGSIADFFERALRPKKKKTTKGDSINLKGQDGAIVLMLCLDGMSDKALIIGQLTHPDRKTKLKDEGPYLEGEYNGVNIKVLKDGSASFTFNGATDNQGKPLDDKQGKTSIDIAKDGSFSVKHENISLMLKRDGNVTLTAKKDINITVEGNAKIDAKGTVDVNSGKDATVTAKGNATVEGKAVNLGKDASEAVIKGDAFKTYFSSHTHPTVVGPSGPPTQPFTPSLLSKKVKTE